MDYKEFKRLMRNKRKYSELVDDYKEEISKKIKDIFDQSAIVSFCHDSDAVNVEIHKPIKLSELKKLSEEFDNSEIMIDVIKTYNTKSLITIVPESDISE